MKLAHHFSCILIYFSFLSQAAMSGSTTYLDDFAVFQELDVVLFLWTVLDIGHDFHSFLSENGMCLYDLNLFQD